jgi:hypothetical protein
MSWNDPRWWLVLLYVIPVDWLFPGDEPKWP